MAAGRPSPAFAGTGAQQDHADHRAPSRPRPQEPGRPFAQTAVADLDHVDVESRRSAMSAPAKWVLLEIFEYRIAVPKQLGELCLKVDRGHGQTLAPVTVVAGRLLGRIGFARPPPRQGRPAPPAVNPHAAIATSTHEQPQQIECPRRSERRTALGGQQKVSIGARRSLRNHHLRPPRLSSPGQHDVQQLGGLACRARHEVTIGPERHVDAAAPCPLSHIRDGDAVRWTVRGCLTWQVSRAS